MHSYKHTLIIGGTGMLAAARQLAVKSGQLTMIARTDHSLQRFGQSIASLPGTPALIRADYNDHTKFFDLVDGLVEKRGSPDLVVAWVHGAGGALRLAEQLAAQSAPVDFYHLLGSASANPANDLAMQRAPFDSLPKLRYHQILLGFMIENGRSRWLTHQEISSGTLDAIDQKLPRHIIGTVEPWAARP